MNYNADKVAKLSSEIYNALDGLKEISEISKDDFLQQRHVIAGAKYYFIVAIEASIDLANHLISQNNFPIPESYADTFKILKDEGVLSRELTNNLVDMAKFRNRLVHIYWDVDDELVYELLSQDIYDIKKFLKEYLEFLKIK